MNTRTYVHSIALCLLFCQDIAGQTIEVLADNLETSMRGLSVIDDHVIWVSGSKGTVGLSTDGGKHWKWQTVKGFEGRDFRDIEAFDDRTAVVMAIAEPAVILRTTDGGATWRTVYENKAPGMFLDAMDFSDDRHGAVIGDPIQGRFFIAITSDGGLSWKEMQADQRPKADSAEACFAASGTNLRLHPYGTSYFVSGGARSRLFINHTPHDLPLLQGQQSTGANSLACHTDKKTKASTWVVVGGNFSSDTLRAGNCALSNNLGKTWSAPTTPPSGYRSCVEFITAASLLTCGTSGVDVSTDSGQHWKNISPIGFHVCRKAKKSEAVFLAGKGRIARLVP
jgi:photosystem II stability/assembly factor-like uncharacterized protein